MLGRHLSDPLRIKPAQLVEIAVFGHPVKREPRMIRLYPPYDLLLMKRIHLVTSEVKARKTLRQATACMRGTTGGLCIRGSLYRLRSFSAVSVAIIVGFR